MRMPNGYGSVYKLSGKRRRPWIVRITTGWDVVNDKPKQICATLGYYESRQLALQALSDYNKNPYDLKVNQVTFNDIYEKWSYEHFEKISDSRQRGTKSAYEKCSDLHNMKFKEIKTAHLEAVLNDKNIGQSTKQHIKTLFNQLYKYALKHDVVEKDYSSLCNSVGTYKAEKDIEVFTDKEIELLWNNTQLDNIDMVLVGLYSGLRPQEIAILENKNINLEEGTMVAGIKTENGINRVVPIHSKVSSLIKKRYSEDKEFLFGDNMNYEKYRYSFKKIMKELKLKHRPHETRHTFTSKAKEVGMDEYILKLIVGHAIADLTERVYTHRTIEQLKIEIEKIH